MAVSKPSLKSLIEEFHALSGAAKMVKRYQITAYIRSIPESVFEREVNEIDSQRDLNVVVGAGPSGVKYKIAMKRGLEIW